MKLKEQERILDKVHGIPSSGLADNTMNLVAAATRLGANDAAIWE